MATRIKYGVDFKFPTQPEEGSIKETNEVKIGDTTFLGRSMVEKDPIDEFVKEPFVPQTKYINEWFFDQENYDKMHDYEQSKVGRYAQGFRHYENFANYSQVKQDATIEDYWRDMNR